MTGADLSECRLKIDHFDKMHVLTGDLKIEGAPNYRQVNLHNGLGSVQL